MPDWELFNGRGCQKAIDYTHVYSDVLQSIHITDRSRQSPRFGTKKEEEKRTRKTPADRPLSPVLY